MAVIARLSIFLERLEASPLKTIVHPQTRYDLARAARMHLRERLLGSPGDGDQNAAILSRAAEMWIRSDDAGHDVDAMHTAWIELAS